jgi:sensor histidine kinase YesM
VRTLGKYGFPALFGLAIYISIRLVNDTTAGERAWERPWQTNAIELAAVFVVSYAFQWLLLTLVAHFNRQRMQTGMRQLVREFALVLGACLALLNLVLIPLTTFTDDGMQLHDLVIGNLIPALYVLLYYAIVRGNHYIRAYAEQQVQLEKIRNEQLQTELQFLKAQYHPHFLFNALNTIYFQMDEDVDAAKQTVEAFSALLRYQLYDHHQPVPVQRELDYLQHFTQLQQKRASDRLRLQVEVHPGLGRQLMYPLLFLPLVENAFKYVGGAYRLDIRADLSGDAICLEVVNSVPPDLPERRGGIGLENLRRRLSLLYGTDHRLAISRNDTTFRAELRIKTLQP